MAKPQHETGYIIRTEMIMKKQQDTTGNIIGTDTKTLEMTKKQQHETGNINRTGIMMKNKQR